MKLGDRVVLTIAARADRHLYDDIGTRTGTVTLVAHWITVDFGIAGHQLVPPQHLEPLTHDQSLSSAT